MKGIRGALPYSIIYVIPGSAFLGAAIGGWGYWLTPFLVFAFLPLLDELIGNEPRIDLAPNALAVYLSDILILFYVPISLWLIFSQAHAFSIPNQDLVSKMGIVISTGLCTGGIGITLAHELIHRSPKFENTMGRLLLAWVCYGHFAVEHVFGHHRNVATPQDPVTAKRGEDIFDFYPKAVLGSWKSAWRIERERLNKKNKGVFSFSNKILQTGSISLMLAVSSGILFGFQGVLFFIFQSWFAFSLLEIINYIEHYGLQRKELQPGKFEPVRPIHSWDSYKKMSNWFLINLQRHSDHHTYANKHFLNLNINESASRLPFGYPTMIIAALIPPLWFKIMHTRSNYLN